MDSSTRRGFLSLCVVTQRLPGAGRPDVDALHLCATVKRWPRLGNKNNWAFLHFERQRAAVDQLIACYADSVLQSLPRCKGENLSTANEDVKFLYSCKVGFICFVGPGNGPILLTNGYPAVSVSTARQEEAQANILGLLSRRQKP